jgi:hypothetical protein
LKGKTVCLQLIISFDLAYSDLDFHIGKYEFDTQEFYRLWQRNFKYKWKYEMNVKSLEWLRNIPPNLKNDGKILCGKYDFTIIK